MREQKRLVMAVGRIVRPQSSEGRSSFCVKLNRVGAECHHQQSRVLSQFLDAEHLSRENAETLRREDAEK